MQTDNEFHFEEDCGYGYFSIGHQSSSASATSLLQANEQKYSGYLKMKSNKTFHRKWKDRFVKVSDGILLIYSTKKEVKLKKQYSFQMIDRVKAHQKNCFIISFKHVQETSITFKCKSDNERKKWMELIESEISKVQTRVGVEEVNTTDSCIKNINTRKTCGDLDLIKPRIRQKTDSNLARDDNDNESSAQKSSYTCGYDNEDFDTSEIRRDLEPIKPRIRQKSDFDFALDDHGGSKIEDDSDCADIITIDNRSERGQSSSSSYQNYCEVSSSSSATSYNEIKENDDTFKMYEELLPKLQHRRRTDSNSTDRSCSLLPDEIYMNVQRMTRSVDGTGTQTEGDNRKNIVDTGEIFSGSFSTEEKNDWLSSDLKKSISEQEAKELLSRGILPDPEEFLLICHQYGRKSSIVRYISNFICQKIKDQSNHIVDVWPAYKHDKYSGSNENHVVFVVITKGKINIESEYQIYRRDVNEISAMAVKENRSISDKEKLGDIRADDITQCLKTNAKRLMEKHTNLTWVTISGIKSIRFGQDEYKKMKSLSCIALYVQIKGFIPIGEDPFEIILDRYPTDVREGVFKLCGSSTDLHQHVRMGCAIDSGFGTQQGTIGPFFRFQTDNYTYLLTSAHVLLNNEQMKRLIKDNQVHYGMFGTDSYQPPESISSERHLLGKTEFAVYRKGADDSSGMEIALVRVDNNRIPVDGQFPDGPNLCSNEDASHAGYKFSIGRQDCHISSLIQCPEVYKFGSVSGLTKGKVRLHGGSVRTRTLNDEKLGEFGITLHNQIEIESVDTVLFGENGDSGSLVFQKEGNTLTAVGIFEGTVCNTYLVSPIYDIRKTLSEFISLYREPPSDTQMDFDEDTASLTMELHYIPPSSNFSIPKTDRGFSDEISRHTKEIQTNILHYTEHNITSVKAEINAVKQLIDNTKTEIKGHVDSQTQSLKQFIQGCLQRP